MASKNILVPTVHLNGTGKGDLTSALRDAHQALHDAVEKLRLCHPHGRDYYIHGSDVIGQAQNEHRDRVARVESVMLEIQRIHQGILMKVPSIDVVENSVGLES